MKRVCKLQFLFIKSFQRKEIDFYVKKNFLMSALGLLLVFVFNGCKKAEVTDGPKFEEVTVTVTPSNQEVKGEQFTLQLSNLRIIKND